MSTEPLFDLPDQPDLADWRLLARDLALDARATGLSDMWWREAPVWLGVREIVVVPVVVTWVVALYLQGWAFVPALVLSVFATWLGRQAVRPLPDSPERPPAPGQRFLAVGCPECGARPGQWCDPERKPTYHSPRSARYKEVVASLGLPDGVQWPLRDRGLGQRYAADVPAWRRRWSADGTRLS